MNILTKLIENNGYLLNSDLIELNKFESNFPVVVKFYSGPRRVMKASDVLELPSVTYKDIKEVFVSAGNLDKLKDIILNQL